MKLTPLLSLLLVLPQAALATDSAAFAFLFSAPLWLASLLAAFAIALLSRSRRGYWGLAIILLLNLLPGVLLSLYLFAPGNASLAGPIHTLAYTLLGVPVVILRRRLARSRG